MSKHPSIEEVTKKNVASIAKMLESAARNRTLGERIADLAAKWVGSWSFLIIQGLALFLWMGLNGIGWASWDPYPFILLNLVLSFQAAFATPIILMSENRQARLSERRNHLDLQINMLAEQENTAQLRMLQLLCEKAGIKLDENEIRGFEAKTKPDSIIRQIIENVEPHS